MLPTSSAAPPRTCAYPRAVGFRFLALGALLLLAGCSRPVSLVAPVPVAVPEELGETPDLLDRSVTAPRRDILGGVAYDLPLEANSWVEAELDFLVEQRREVIGRWLQRGDPYEGYIKRILAEEGVPTDLYHLAMIESGFIPTARSRAGAVGLWQFMPATGRQMGLRVDSIVDERMDPVRSTRAAARHLRALHRTFRGDWALAAAAYNAGSGRISRGMQNFGARDFWDLAQRGDLAEETRHYVPRLYAMTIIARDRQRFGFAPPQGTSTFAYDSIQVEYATPLAELASMGEPNLEQLSRLNPHLLRGGTPEGGYWVWVPQGHGVALQRAYLASEFRKNAGYGTYVVRAGDNLGKLAQLSGLRAAHIRELNPGVDFDRLRTGESLRLPFQLAHQLTSRPVPVQPPAQTVARSEVTQRRSGTPTTAGTTHTVSEGETLWAIARKHGVAIGDIQEANSLSSPTIRPGQTLRIPASAAAARDIAAAASVEHVVQSGDSLWSIARRYGSSVDAIQSANQLGDRPIVPGQKLSIPQGN